jgi:quinol monooxygenase YgiN
MVISIDNKPIMSVKLIAILHCQTDAEETFEQELKRLVEASVAEEGCLKYELYQYENERCRYLIQEEWRDDTALKKHQESSHYKNFGRVAPVLLVKPAKIKILTRLA